MVALAVPRLDYVPRPNFARAFLFRATDALDRGDTLSAGVLLREAVRRQLWAECEWFDCLPDDASEKMSPDRLLRALKRAGHATKIGISVARECLEYGNACAHVRRVKPSYLRVAIEMFHRFIDATPCCEPANMPGLPQQATSSFECWDDEFDPADWWKRDGEGGAA